MTINPSSVAELTAVEFSVLSLVGEQQSLTNHLQIRGARVMLGLTQGQLATLAGISRRTVAAVESGSGISFESTLERLRSALELKGVFFVDSDDATGIMIANDCWPSGSVR